MKSFESYKYSANSIKLLGIACCTPFASSIYMFLMMDMQISDIVFYKALGVVILLLFGLKCIFQGVIILERCDARINNNDNK